MCEGLVQGLFMVDSARRLMTLHITLRHEAEAQLRRRAAEVGKDPAEFAREALEEKLAFSSHAAADETRLPADQRVAELLRWVASHKPLERDADDSRESIYEGRGE
jgi:hypothetical protein